MKNCKLMWVVLLMLVSHALSAQQSVEMADTLRSEGKIYVVVVIILIIFTGLATYLFLMDRKVSRLEKKYPDKTA